MKEIQNADNHISAKRRSRLDIIAGILDAAVEETVKTRIMNKTSVNFIQFKEYLQYLLEAGLIESRKGKKKTTYRITERGKLLLQRFKEIEEMCNNKDTVECNRPVIVKKSPMIYLIKK